jgi:hypothetical protein
MRVLTVCLLLCLTAAPAHAYIDLGTGSYVLQMLAAFCLGFLFALKLYWKRFTAFVGRCFGRKPPDDDPAA